MLWISFLGNEYSIAYCCNTSNGGKTTSEESTMQNVRTLELRVIERAALFYQALPSDD